MKPILEIRNLWKSYQIGAKRERYLSLRDSMVNILKNGRQKKEAFWALRDVSFDVYPGDTLGIIGRNGAGKTTLLKILSRITPPTRGSITVRGRLASLLEVGTGFHPELTGRENIYLNGSILGLKRREINRQFDAIVDFSGVEQFLDTPLKHYSSGMQLRLAFAVAAHLEPEILVIDEVLAVGDAEFQKRCMGKMEEVAKSGRTILFVSHNLGAVKQLCTKGLVLENGELNFTGNSIESIRTYSALYEDSDNHQSFWVNNIDENPKVLLKRIELINQEDKLSSTFTNSEDIFIHFHLKAFKSIQKFTQAFDLVKDDAIVFRSRQVDSIDFDSLIEGEEKHLICRIPKWFLNVGTYYIKPMISVHCEEYLSKAYDINLSFTIVFDQSRSPYHIVLNERNHPGFIFPTLEWSIQS